MLKKQTRLTPAEAQQATQALEILFASEHINKKRLYWANFVRGLFFSLGSVLGVAIMVSLLLWVLSFTSRIPLIGPVFENVQDTVQDYSKKN
jgi:hypothetical protein